MGSAVRRSGGMDPFLACRLPAVSHVQRRTRLTSNPRCLMVVPISRPQRDPGLAIFFDRRVRPAMATKSRWGRGWSDLWTRTTTRSSRGSGLARRQGRARRPWLCWRPVRQDGKRGPWLQRRTEGRGGVTGRGTSGGTCSSEQGYRGGETEGD